MSWLKKSTSFNFAESIVYNCNYELIFTVFLYFVPLYCMPYLMYLRLYDKTILGFSFMLKLFIEVGVDEKTDI